jgi:hypothetical protein
MIVNKLRIRRIFFVIGIMNVYGQLVAEEIDLKLYERRLISQNGEDGVLQEIFDLIGTTNKYYVDFGAGNGHFCSNVKYLREAYGWRGLLLEGARTAGDPSINLHHAFITAENICDLFQKYDVPQEFDLICIDIDGNDFYVWKALSAQYRPRVVIIECNPYFRANEDKVMQYDAKYMWDGSEYCGASVLALANLGRKLGYSFVYQEQQGINLFFIRDDVLELTGVKFKNINDVPKLYTGKPMNLDPRRRIFVSSSTVLS